MMLFSYFIQRTNKQQQKKKDSENDYFKPKAKPREIKK